MSRLCQTRQSISAPPSLLCLSILIAVVPSISPSIFHFSFNFSDVLPTPPPFSSDFFRLNVWCRTPPPPATHTHPSQALLQLITTAISLSERKRNIGNWSLCVLLFSGDKRKNFPDFQDVVSWRQRSSRFDLVCKRLHTGGHHR